MREKKFEEPKMEIISFEESNDQILTSGDTGVGGGAGEDGEYGECLGDVAY